MHNLSYQDVNLVAKYSDLPSRDLADVSVDFCGRKFKLPVVPANMQDVIDVPLARYFANNGYFYIYHRFNDTLEFVMDANKEKWKLISISTGVNEDTLKELGAIKHLKQRVDFITIDVAHGHHLKVKQRIQWIKENLPNAKVIAGNIMTLEAYIDFQNWGADAAKVGVGQGSICTTRFQTGFSMPMFSCVDKIVRSCYIYKPMIPIIADGGIKNIGDIPKALVAGATMVMSGKLFASCIDSPAQINSDGKKEYRGSTSFAAKKHNKHIEGKTIDLESDISVKERLTEIEEALQSSISYAGGIDLSAFRTVQWIQV